jgi:HEAT repeat protein
MSPLTDALNRIETWFVKNQPKFALGLQPGLKREEIDEIVTQFPFPLPEELYELYEWHNGCKSFGYVIPHYDNFFSLQQVLACYQDYLSWDSEWNPHWLSILDGNGDYRYAVVVGEETAPVWYIDPECGIEEICWNSLTDLMLAAAECYETNAYYISNEGYLEEDKQKVAEIQRKYNYRGTENFSSDESYNPYPPTVASQVDLSNPNALEQLTQALQAAPLSPDASTLQAMAANTLENLANLGLSEEIGAEPLVIGLQNIIYDGAGHALAAQKLGELGDARAIEPLLQALRDRSSEVRTNAIEALAKLGDPRVVEPLIQCLQDSNFFVRAKAAWALAELGDVKAIEPLIQALKEENQSTACGAIASALGKFADVRAIDPLIEVLRSNGHNLRNSFSFPHVRVSLIRSLGLIEDSRTTDALVEVLRDRESILQTRSGHYWYEFQQATQLAVEELFKRQHPELMEILTQLLQDSEWQIRCNTLSALTRISDVQMVDLLILGLADEDVLLRKTAIRSLGERGETRAVEPLIRLLQDLNADVRLEVVQALEKIDDARVVDALIGMLKDESPNVRCAAALALGNLENPKAVEPLNQCLEDDSPLVRKMAQEALNKLS